MYFFWKNSPVTTNASLKIFLSAPLALGLFTQGVGSKLVIIDAIMKDVFVNELGFAHLDMYEISKAKLDFFDGWHWGGVVTRMNAMILLNMMCHSP